MNCLLGFEADLRSSSFSSCSSSYFCWCLGGKDGRNQEFGDSIANAAADWWCAGCFASFIRFGRWSSNPCCPWFANFCWQSIAEDSRTSCCWWTIFDGFANPSCNNSCCSCTHSCCSCTHFSHPKWRSWPGNSKARAWGWPWSTKCKWCWQESSRLWRSSLCCAAKKKGPGLKRPAAAPSKTTPAGSKKPFAGPKKSAKPQAAKGPGKGAGQGAGKIADNRVLKLGCKTCRGTKRGCNTCRNPGYKGERMNRSEWKALAAMHGWKWNCLAGVLTFGVAWAKPMLYGEDRS